jgi:hypothetical protein
LERQAILWKSRRKEVNVARELGAVRPGASSVLAADLHFVRPPDRK